MRPRPSLVAGGLAVAAILASAGTAVAGPIGLGDFAVADSQPVTVTLTLTSADNSALTAYATAITTPGNPAYGQHLSRAQLKVKFGAPSDRVNRVTKWAKGAGFKVGALDGTGTRLTLTGTARTARAAFNTGIVTQNRNGVRAQTAIGQPAKPAPVAADIAAIGGLTQQVAQPMIARPGASAPKAGKPAATPNAAGDYCSTYWGEWNKAVPQKYPAGQQSNLLCGYNGNQLRTMYGLGTADTGAGQTITIVGAFDSGSALADANRAFAANGVAPLRPDQLIIKQYINGDGDDHGCDVPAWISEQALDIQAIHTIAPAATILYAKAPSCVRLEDTIASVIGDPTIDTSIINNSWSLDGEPASDTGYLTATNNVLAQAAVLGFGTYFSSADHGDFTTSPGHSTPAVAFPSSSPWTTAVGGTTTGLANNGATVLNTGWEASANTLTNGVWKPTNPAFLTGAGGGTSAIFDKPTWQTDITPGTHRAVPDIAALADPWTGLTIGYTYQGQYRQGPFGGTSLASPIIASLVAVAQARAGGGFTVGLLAPVLYAKANAGKPVTADITHASAGIWTPGISNTLPRGDYLLDVDTTNQALKTGPGYDLVTGLGTPNSTFLTEITK